VRSPHLSRLISLKRAWSGPSGSRCAPCSGASSAASTVTDRGAPLARRRSGFARGLGCLARRAGEPTHETTITRLPRIDWAAVRRIVAGVQADDLDPDAGEPVRDRDRPRVPEPADHSLTLDADLLRGQERVGHEGNEANTAGRFFNQIGKRAGPDVTAAATHEQRSWAGPRRQEPLRATSARFGKHDPRAPVISTASRSRHVPLVRFAGTVGGHSSLREPPLDA
jgi:hypothetical protein